MDLRKAFSNLIARSIHEQRHESVPHRAMLLREAVHGVDPDYRRAGGVYYPLLLLPLLLLHE